MRNKIVFDWVTLFHWWVSINFLYLFKHVTECFPTVFYSQCTMDIFKRPRLGPHWKFPLDSSKIVSRSTPSPLLPMMSTVDPSCPSVAGRSLFLSLFSAGSFTSKNNRCSVEWANCKCIWYLMNICFSKQLFYVHMCMPTFFAVNNERPNSKIFSLGPILQ